MGTRETIPNDASSGSGTPPVDGAHGEQPGDVIGAYTLIGIIGEGGFGVVWMAERRKPFVQRVALKIIKPGMGSRSVIARFEQERQSLALLDHPNIARVIDGGVTQGVHGRPYFVMEFVGGEQITSHCDVHCHSIRHRLELFVSVCDAIQHAHNRGIIHRDIKPSNVLVSTIDSNAPNMGKTPPAGHRGLVSTGAITADVPPSPAGGATGAQGEPAPEEDRRSAAGLVGDELVKVIDFGIAKAIASAGAPGEDDSAVTLVGHIMGTPAYMSPEQSLGVPDRIDTRSDVYSLGVLLHELLTGRLPLDPRGTRSLAELQKLIREAPVARPSDHPTTDLAMREAARRRGLSAEQLRAQLRAELEWIPLKALAKEPERRYRSPADLADDVRRYLSGQPLAAGPESRVYRLRKAAARNKGLVGAVAAVALSLVAGTVVASIGFANASIRATEAEESNRLRQIESARATTEAAERAGQRGDWEFAISLADELLAAGQGNEIGLRLLRVEGLDALDRSADAEAEIARVEALGPRKRDLARTLLWKGELAFVSFSRTAPSGQELPGVALVRQALDIAGGLNEAERAFANSLIAEQFADVVRFAREAVRLDTHSIRFRTLLAYMLIMDGRVQEGLAETGVLTQQSPKSLRPLFLRGLCAAFLQQNETVEEMLRRLGEGGVGSESIGSLRSLFASLRGTRDLDAIKIMNGDVIATAKAIAGRFGLGIMLSGLIDLSDPRRVVPRLPAGIAQQIPKYASPVFLANFIAQQDPFAFLAQEERRMPGMMLPIVQLQAAITLAGESNPVSKLLEGEALLQGAEQRTCPVNLERVIHLFQFVIRARLALATKDAEAAGWRAKARQSAYGIMNEGWTPAWGGEGETFIGLCIGLREFAWADGFLDCWGRSNPKTPAFPKMQARVAVARGFKSLALEILTGALKRWPKDEEMLRLRDSLAAEAPTP